MFLFLHAPVGIIIAEQVTQNPIAAFAIGVLSHFLIDIVPHGDRQMEACLMKLSPGTRTRVLALFGAVDTTVLAGILIYSYDAIFPPFNVLAAVIGAVAPDFIWGLHELTKWRFLDGYRRFHGWFQSFRGRDVPFWFGIGYQIGLTCLLIYLIKGGAA